MHSFRHQIERLINTYPLHPYDIQEIEEQEKVFDNIEARIDAYPDVHFEIVNGYDNNGPDHFPQFARILTPEEAELKDWDAYKNYLFNSEWFPIANTNGGFIGTKADSDEIMTQELFINKIKTDDEFAKKWGELGPNHFPTYAKTIEEAELKDWDVTLNDGLESELRDYNTMNKLDRQKLVKKWESSGLLDNIKGEASNTDMVKLLECKATQLLDEPYVSDNFQIGPDGAYEHIEYAKSTMVFAGEGNWGRSAYIKLEDNKVIFDCSDEEYGPIVFDIDLLKDALNKHII